MSKRLMLHFLDGSNLIINNSIEELSSVIVEAKRRNTNFINTEYSAFNIDYLISASEVDDEA